MQVENRKINDRLEELILTSYEAMYRMAYTYMKNEQDSMDVVQETVLKAMKGVSKVREESFLKTWLFRILINTAVDELEKRKKILPLFTENEESKEDVYEDTDILNVLERLDANEKTVITLRYFEEWKIEDISIFMEKNVNTVKSTLYRALRKMKTELMKGEEKL